MFDFTCPDCERGGERWETAEALAMHLAVNHPTLWTFEQIQDEIAEQEAMQVAVAR